jgi:acetyl-CoA C-acetyltransferase
VAQRIGANPESAIYSIVGGQSPQQLVNEAAARIAAGETGMVLLTGAEAIGAARHAQRNDLPLDWNEHIEGDLEDRGTGPELVNGYEIANGMGFAPQVYGALENAWRQTHGLSKAENRRRMSELFERFSAVAATNPYAQFPTALDADYLATPSHGNYIVAEPYLKWHVAQDAVNQGAALILTSVGKARELGIDEERWVYLRAGADGTDKLVSVRERLDASVAMAAVLRQTLAQGKVSISEVDHLDLYSCFPCAVQFACDALDIDAFSRQLTQTGGLPFFGGAGNNYSMHAIASLVDTLRDDPGSLGLILANGGFASKESAGLYSTQPNENWQPVDNAPVRAEIDSAPEVAVVDAAGGGRIESYSVVYNKTVPLIGYAFCRTEEGGRFMARSATGDEATLKVLIEEDPMGEFVTPVVTAKRNELRL